MGRTAQTGKTQTGMIQAGKTQTGMMQTSKTQTGKTQTGMNKRQTRKQVMAIAFVVCFMVVSLLSGAFMAIQTDHTHDHNDAQSTHDAQGTCAICIGLQHAETFLKLIGSAVVGGFPSAAGLWLCIAAVIIDAIWANILFLTPITAKIRMNN